MRTQVNSSLCIYWHEGLSLYGIRNKRHGLLFDKAVKVMRAICRHTDALNTSTPHHCLIEIDLLVGYSIYILNDNRDDTFGNTPQTKRTTWSR